MKVSIQTEADGVVLRPCPTVEVHVGKWARVDEMEISGTDCPAVSGTIRIYIGNFASVSRGVLVSLDWDLRKTNHVYCFGDPNDPTVLQDEEPKTVRIGHGAMVGPRATLAAGSTVGNCGVVPPNQFVGLLCHGYRQLHAPMFDSWLSKVVNRLRWWEVLNPLSASRCERDRYRILRVLRPSVTLRHADQVSLHMKDIARDLPVPEGDLREIRTALVCGSHSFFFSFARRVLSLVRGGNLQLHRVSFSVPEEERCSTFDAVCAILRAFGVYVSCGPARASRLSDLRLHQHGFLPTERSLKTLGFEFDPVEGFRES